MVRGWSEGLINRAQSSHSLLCVSSNSGRKNVGTLTYTGSMYFTQLLNEKIYCTFIESF